MEEIEPTNSNHHARYTRLPLAVASVSIIGLISLVVSSDPGHGGPIVILFFLLLTFIACLSLVAVLIQLLVGLFGKKLFSWVRILYTSVAISSGVLFLIGLQTLKQLQLVDIVLVVVFEVMLNFYLFRRF